MNDTFTGKLIKKVKVGGEDEWVGFTQHLGDKVVCGVKYGTVTFILPTPTSPNISHHRHMEDIHLLLQPRQTTTNHWPQQIGEVLDVEW